MAAQRRAVIAYAAMLLFSGAALLPACSAAVDSVVTQWLTIAQSTVLSVGLEHQQAARLYGIVASAQYDAILFARKNSAAPVPDEVAAAFASHAALSALFNWRQTLIYDVALARHLAQYNVSDALVPSLQGQFVPLVQKILGERLRDNSTAFANFRPYSNASTNAGRYQFVPGQTTARFPQLATSRPFYLTSEDVDSLTATFTRFALSDPEYARQLRQVYLYGSINSTVRSAYDSDSPRFWALGAGTGTVAGIWLNISFSVIPDNTPLVQQARFFKIFTTSLWDAAVACFRTKYRELFWRPITAIRWPYPQPDVAAGSVPVDAAWSPLLSTPQHPEYPSGHQCTSGVAVYILEAFLGATTTFNVSSGGAPDLPPRPYPSFRAAGIEVGDSRLFGGVHLNKSNVDGLNLGYAVARFIHKNKFKSATFSTRI